MLISYRYFRDEITMTPEKADLLMKYIAHSIYAYVYSVALSYKAHSVPWRLPQLAEHLISLLRNDCIVLCSSFLELIGFCQIGKTEKCFPSAQSVAAVHLRKNFKHNFTYFILSTYRKFFNVVQFRCGICWKCTVWYPVCVEKSSRNAL